MAIKKTKIDKEISVMKKIKEFDHNSELDLLSKYMKYHIDKLYQRGLGKKVKSNSFEEWKEKNIKRKPALVRGREKTKPGKSKRK